MAPVVAAVCSLLGRAYREIDFGAEEGSDASGLIIELFPLLGGKGDGWRDNNVAPPGTLAALPDAGGYAVDQEERKADCALVACAVQGGEELLEAVGHDIGAGVRAEDIAVILRDQSQRILNRLPQAFSIGSEYPGATAL